jgi:SAM-dependent methyltransferase
MTIAGPDFWDSACHSVGHTGYRDALLHSYDQPLRLRTVRRILDDLFPEGLTGTRALDIGCGTGDFVDLLNSKGAVVTGFDISPAVIEQAKVRFSGRSSINLLCGSLPDVELPSGAFDLITSVTVLQHILDDTLLVEALKLLRKALKPDGYMVVLELAPPHDRAIRRSSGDVEYLAERPPFQWEAMLHCAGFEIQATPVFPQLGITLLRELARLINRLRKYGSGHGKESTGELRRSKDQQSRSLSLSKRVVRMSYEIVRHVLVLLATPCDYAGGSRFLPSRFSHYRAWVVTAAG